MALFPKKIKKKFMYLSFFFPARPNPLICSAAAAVLTAAVALLFRRYCMPEHKENPGPLQRGPGHEV